MGDPLPGLQMAFLVNRTGPQQPYHQSTFQPGFPPSLKALILPGPWNMSTNQPPAPKPFASGSWVLMEAESLSQGPHTVRLDIPRLGHGHFSNTTYTGIEIHSQNKSVSH